MTDLGDFARLVGRDHGLCIVSTLAPTDEIQSTLVNAGVLRHPLRNEDVVAFVARGDSRKLRHLRARPHATITVRAGWEWVTAAGRVELVGPDDPVPGIDAERLRLLLREVFSAAGGTHDDWPTYDSTMAAERRTVVLVAADHVYSNA
jgi:PPOX class probable F420-dependent enzyme